MDPPQTPLFKLKHFYYLNPLPPPKPCVPPTFISLLHSSLYLFYTFTVILLAYTYFTLLLLYFLLFILYFKACFPIHLFAYPPVWLSACLPVFLFTALLHSS